MTIGLLESSILTLAPGYIRGPNIGRFLRSYAAMQDGNLAAIQVGGALGNPLTCPVEHLPAISKDRSLPIFDNEPEWSKRQSLADWLQIHRFRGSSRGRIMRLRNFFLGETGTGSIPTIYAIHRKAGQTWWHWITPAGVYDYQNNVDNFDNAPSDDPKWSQTFIIVEMSETDYTAPNTYDDGHLYDDGEVYDAGGANPLSVVAHAAMVSMTRWAGAAHAWLTAMILNWGAPIDITASPVQDPDGWWSLPNTKWWLAYDPSNGNKWTRPPYMQWLVDNNPP